MGKFSQNSFLQAYGCCLIGNLWLRPGLRRSVVDDGGLANVIVNNAVVQQEGIWALSMLLDGYDDSTTFAETMSGVVAECMEHVISAMANHADYAEIQMYGCDFLFQLSSKHWIYRNRIIQVKGLVAVVEAMRIHTGNAYVKQSAHIHQRLEHFWRGSTNVCCSAGKLVNSSIDLAA
jgi:hypothetical protein